MQQLPGNYRMDPSNRLQPAKCRVVCKEQPAAIPHLLATRFEILDALPMFIYLLTSDYTFHFVNSCFRKEFGVPDEFTRCYAMLRKSHTPCEPCPAMAVFTDRTERIWRWRDSLRGKVYQIHDVPYHTPGGTLLVLGIGIDISKTGKPLNSLENPAPAAEDIVRICCHCRNICNRNGSWQQIESYFHQTLGVHFSHTICPECLRIHYPEIQFES